MATSDTAREHHLPSPRRAVAAFGGLGDQARAIFRLLAAAAVGAVLLIESSPDASVAATAVPLAAGLWIVVSTVLSWPNQDDRWQASSTRPWDVVRATCDIVAICAVASAVEQPRIAMLLLLCAVPLGYGLTLVAPAVLVITASAVAGALGVWALTSTLGTPDIAESSLLLVTFAVGWAGLVGCLIAVERERRARRIDKLSVSVQDMLGQALGAEAGERNRVADLLHDDVLQLLLATRHDITDAIDGDLSLLPDARVGIEAATTRLRETIAALRDARPVDEGLGDGLRSLALDPSGHRDTVVDVEVDRAVDGEVHPVLVSASRDLLRDAETASAAKHVVVTAVPTGAAVRLTLHHDDRRHALGLDVSTEAAAIVHDVRARVEAVDGRLDIAHDTDGERIVTITVPARRPTSPAPASLSVYPTSKLG